MAIFDKSSLSSRENIEINCIKISALPTTIEDFISLPGTDLKDPNQVVALTIVALSMYPKEKNIAIIMLDYLRGPSPLSTYEKQFLKDRFRGKDYLINSYFKGATPENNYQAQLPLEIQVVKTTHSEDLLHEGYLQLYVKSGGADSLRGVKLRNKPSTGQWFLWEYHLLPDIRKPVAEDPWA